MKNTTEDRLKRIRIWCWITASVVTVIGLALVYFTPALRYNQLAFDREEVEQRTREVRERAEAVREQQEKERAERKLSEAHAKRLTEEVEKRERAEVIRQLREVRDLQEKIERENQVRRGQVERLGIAERMDQRLDPLRRNLERTLDAIDAIQRPETDQSLPKDFREDLNQKKENLTGLLEKVNEGYDEKILDQIAEEAQELAESTTDFDPKEDKGLDSQRRQLIWATRDTIRDIDQLRDDAAQMARFAESSAEDAASPQTAPLDPSIEAALDAPEEASMAELYEAAQAMEERLNHSLDEARATELAKRQGSGIEEARAKLIPSNAQLEDLPALGEPTLPGTIGELNERRASVAEAARRVDQLNRRAHEASEQFLASGSERPSVLSTGNSLQQALQNQLNAAAQRSQPGSLNDMSGLMRLAVSESTGGAGYIDDDRLIRNEKGSANQSAAQSTAAPRLAGNHISANALPGRRFSESSSREGWLYLDTWYVIGPWDNDGDLHSFDIPHPPESEINFDGVYSGKTYSRGDAARDARQGIDRGYTPGEARPLRWNFIQSDSIRIDIPDETSDATYYLYTDVYFEEGRDMLLAIGSDDAAKVWINGIVVWLDKNLSPWNLGENFSKVYFKQGYNSILVRLENGPSRCELSLLICPPTI